MKIKQKKKKDFVPYLCGTIFLLDKCEQSLDNRSLQQEFGGIGFLQEIIIKGGKPHTHAHTHKYTHTDEQKNLFKIFKIFLANLARIQASGEAERKVACSLRNIHS